MNKSRLRYITNNYFSIPKSYQKEFSIFCLKTYTAKEFAAMMYHGEVEGFSIIWVNAQKARDLLSSDEILVCSFRKAKPEHDIHPVVLVTAHWNKE